MANNTGKKYGGREAGTPNKLTAKLRKRVNHFLSDNWDCIQTEFEKLEPKEKLQFYEKLLQYGLPKMQHTQLLTNNYTTKKDLEAIFPTIDELAEITTDDL